MKTNRFKMGAGTLLLLITCSPLAQSEPAASEKNPLKKEKLQIVFCFGQSNMVGAGNVATAWYATRPLYVPPAEIVTKPSRYFNFDNLYWSGARNYTGPKRAELDALIEERRLSRSKWRGRIRGGGEWNPKWGTKPELNRGAIYQFLDEKAEEEGIYKRIAAILDSDENTFRIEDAYAEMADRDNAIADELKRLRENFLPGTKPEDFDKFGVAVQDALKSRELILTTGRGAAFPEAEKHRSIYAGLAKKHLNMPVAKRTFIKAIGHNAGPASEGENGMNRKTAEGLLKIGYGSGVDRIGPEYSLGITLEKLVDAPILLVKCAWGNTALAAAWRPPSLDGVETPIEKAQREKWNGEQAKLAKAAGREFTPRPAPEPLGALNYAWNMTMPEVDKVLADPGKYHPEYDPKVGYDIAGFVWFQGYSDKDNPAYGELLVEMIKGFRKKVNAPKMPVVCGTLGMASFKHLAFADAANQGMLEASQHPELKGTVDVVKTTPYYPVELLATKQVLNAAEQGSPAHNEALEVRQRATSDAGYHYCGNAKFFLLTGDAMARSLANLMAGGEPTIQTPTKTK